MSRFANRRATGRLVLTGGCQCPGTPHDEDWIELRTQLGTADVLAISDGTGIDALERLVVDWNLQTDDGQVAPVDREHIGDLYSDAFDQLDKWMATNLVVSTLPNGSGARSQSGSRTSATSSRGKRTAR